MESINELMKENARLKKELERYKDLLENLSDVVQSVNADGMIVFTNKKASELFGYTKKELLRMMIDDLYAPDLWKDVGKGFKKLIKEGYLNNIKTAVITKNGERIDVEISSNACYDDDGKFIGTRSVLRKIGVES